MSFAIKWNADMSDGHKKGQVRYKNETICTVKTWGFSSCAVWQLQDWYTWNMAKGYTPEQFWEFFTTKMDGLDGDWLPTEIYFLVSDGQRNTEAFKKLVSVPNVRRIDKFLNKAHGPNHVHLYRWSAQDDFPKRRLSV